MGDPFLCLNQLSYSRRLPSGEEKVLLDHLDLEISAGTLTLVSGPSGSGKSTLLSVLAGVYPGWGGTVFGGYTLDGRDFAGLTGVERRRMVGYLPQDPARYFLFPTVAEECAFPLSNGGCADDEIKHRTQMLLESWGIAELMPRKLRQLSGGEQVLVSLAAACASQPRLLLLDEPLASLDDIHTRRVLNGIRLLREKGTTLVVCDHRLEAWEGLADHKRMLHRGRWFEGSPVFPKRSPRIPPPRHPTEPVLVLDQIDLSRGGRTLAQGVTLGVSPGEIVYLTGANGIGKSSLLRLIAGYEKPGRGTVTLRGTLRLVGQNPSHHLCRSTVKKELTTGRRLKKDHGPVSLGELGLEGQEGQSPFTLSEGEKRRLVYGRARGATPQVLLLDEPTAGLDPENTGLVAEETARYLDQGGAVVCATHDAELMRLLPGRTLALETFAPLKAEQATSPQAHQKSKKGPGFDPRVGFVWFLLCLVLALCPLPRLVGAGFLVLMTLTYLHKDFMGQGLRFLRSMVLFCLFPSVLLFFISGWESVADSVVRILLVSLVFHRYSLGVRGESLILALNRWGLPYPMLFAFSAAGNQIPVLEEKLGFVGESLGLYFQREKSIWVSSDKKPRLRSRFSWRGFRFLFLPVTVVLWEQAVYLAIALDLKNFTGAAPRQKEGRKLKKREILLISLALLTGLAAGVVLSRFFFS